ncbi:hypothetical protein BGZ94_002919 [Podila epigama]|nr:hypothetical protein BGZ94_002919 [Podila epigama]
MGMSSLLRARSLLSSIAPVQHALGRLQTSYPIHSSLRVSTGSSSFSSSATAQTVQKVKLSKKITIPKDPYLLSEKVVKFSKNGKLDEAITLVRESPNSRQNEVVWNHLIQESSKLGKTSQSFQLLNDMKKRNFEPNERTFTILLNGLALNSSSPNNVSRALELYRLMEESEDISPTITHTNALLKVCSRKPDYDALSNVYSNMPKNGPNAPDIITYTTLVSTFARKGGDEGFRMAWKIWEDFLAAKTRLSDNLRLDARLVDSILLACREAKSPSYVKRGYSLVQSLYGLTTPSAQTPSTTPSGKNAGSISPSKARGVGAALSRDDIQSKTVELLISICTKLKEYQRGQQYYDLIQATYPDFKPDGHLLATMMHLQIASKDYEKAVNTWDEISKMGLQHMPATFRQGLDAAFRARNWDKTMEMYTKMQQLVTRNQKIDTSHRRVNPIVQRFDAWTLSSIAQCAVKTKHYEEGLQVLRDAKWAKVVQSPQYPRANVDVAVAAVKIHSAILSSRVKASMKEGLSAEESKEIQDSIENMKAKVEEVKAIEAHLSQVLEGHDAERYRENMEENFAKNPQLRPFMQANKDTSLNSNDLSKKGKSNGSGFKVAALADGGWRKVSSDEYRQEASRTGGFSPRPSPRGSPRGSHRVSLPPREGRSLEDDDTKRQKQREDRRRRHDSAFELTTKFTREIPE